jgi:hypothetical protein
MTAFAEYKRKVIRLLGDTVATNDDGTTELAPVQGSATSAELLMDACHAALHAITTRQWKSACFEIAEEGDVFELPADLLEIDAVYDSTLEIIIPKLTYSVGQSLTSLEGNSWIDVPYGSITFINALKSSGAKIYYSAAWTLPSDDNDSLESPEVCLTALILYGASYCYLRKAAEQSELGAVKTRVDAGGPEDIPARLMSDFLLKRFENELTRVPMKQKVSQ